MEDYHFPTPRPNYIQIPFFEDLNAAIAWTKRGGIALTRKWLLDGSSGKRLDLVMKRIGLRGMPDTLNWVFLAYALDTEEFEKCLKISS